MASLAAFLLALGAAAAKDELLELVQSPQLPDQVFVLSSSNTLSALSSETGAVQWQQQTADGPRLLKAEDDVLITARSASNSVEVWEASNGQRRWSESYPDQVVDVLKAGGKDGSFFVVRESNLEARSSSGNLKWSVATDGPVAGAVLQAGTLCTLTAATSTQLLLDSGMATKQTAVPAVVAEALKSGEFIVAGGHVALIVGEVLYTHPLCGQQDADMFDLKIVATRPPRPNRLLPWRGTPGVFVVTNDAFTFLFKVTTESTPGLRILRVENAHGVIGPALGEEGAAGVPIAEALVRKEGYELQLVGSSSAKELQKTSVADSYAEAAHGVVERLVARRVASGEYRFILAAADHSLVAIQGGKRLWSRDDGRQARGAEL